MRKLYFIGLVISLMACTPALYADSIVPGDIITLTYSSSHVSGFAGGPFNVNKGGEFQFETFCVETGEYFTPGHNLEVLSISDHTIATGTMLSEEAAYLYYAYREGLGNNRWQNVIGVDPPQIKFPYRPHPLYQKQGSWKDFNLKRKNENSTKKGSIDKNNE